MADAKDPLWHPMAGWSRAPDMVAAADLLVTADDTIVLRLLAEASARRATGLKDRTDPDLLPGRERELEAAWHWSQALDYLEAAGVLTERANVVAHQLLDGRPWPGTLAELVTTAQTVADG